jgi:hypothetical protein
VQVASFYRDAEIEVTDAVVKTASEIYPLEQIADLKAEKRYWGSGAAAALLAAGLLWLPAGFIGANALEGVLDADGSSNFGRMIGFATLVPSGLLLAQSVRLFWAKKYRLTFNWHFSGMSGFAFVELTESNELEPMEKIATAIRDAQAAMKRAA